MKRQSLLTLSLLALLGANACQTEFTGPRQPWPSLEGGKQSSGLFFPSTLNTLGISQDIIDDSGLTPARKLNVAPRLSQEALRIENGTLVFRAVALKPQPLLSRQGPLQVSGEFRYPSRLNDQDMPAANATVALFQGARRVAQTLTDEQGRWQIPLNQAGEYRIVFTLENPRWKLDKYAWDGPAVNVQGTVDTGAFTLQRQTQNAQAAYIHEIYNQSLQLFQRENIGTQWWKRQIKTIWPADSDYYVSDTVNLTGAEQWDVNGHEIGHAIYHQALNAASRGGFHKIDECYDGTLAFSEGFATFFSGAVQLSKEDEDARFGPYLVPRRAPIRIENVPGDVCGGNRNEWRVASVLWDVYDAHRDGEDQLTMPLQDMWTAFSQQDKPKIKNALDAYKLLQGLAPETAKVALEKVFKQNTIEIGR